MQESITYTATKTKLDTIQHLQTRLSAALEMNCYPDEGFLAQLSMTIEHQLYELEHLLEHEGAVVTAAKSA